MIYELNTVRQLYRKLLSFYPRAFREELAESMEQTFHDLCNEKRQTNSGLFSFVLWTFIETTTGIIQEHLLTLTHGDPMKNILTTLRSPALISLLLVIPFMILELVNRRNLNSDFPFPLFGFLWILPVIFIVLIMPIVRDVRAGKSIIAKPVGVLLRVIFLVLILWMWVGLVIDQMPCFLGVPNCD
jgi:uncharacterized membrane protein